MQRSAFQTVVTWLKVGGLALATLASLSVFNFAYADTQTRASAFEYDTATGLLTKEIIEPDDPNLCLVTTYTYDTFGNKTGATTRNCNGIAGSHPGVNSEAAAPAANSVAKIDIRTTTTTYDSKGQFPISTTNAIGQTETKTYNANFGTVATLTGPNNLTTSWTYDSFGRPLTETRADGTSTSTAYALCDATCLDGGAIAKYTITITQAGAPYSIVSYDMYGRKIQTQTQDVNGAAVLSQVKYDNQGRAYQISQPFKSGTTALWTTVEFDKLDRPVKVTAPDGNIMTTTYNGYTTTTTNAKGQTKTEVKNSQGQLVTVTDTQDKSMAYQYDPFGNLVKTTDALNNVTILAYDKRGRKTAMDDPDQGVWTYQYDALGQLAKQTDAKFQTVSFVYDKLGRMTRRNEPELISNWYFDTCEVLPIEGASPQAAGKCVGKMVRETSDNGTTQLTSGEPGYIANDPKRYQVKQFFYDQYGRPTTEGNTGTKIYLTKGYIANTGQVSGLIYGYAEGAISHQFQVKYDYQNGYLKKVISVPNDTSPVEEYWTAGATDNAGRLTQQIYGNGVTNTTTYDPLTGRIVQVQAGANNSISNQSFVYDSIGNLTQRYDAVTNLKERFDYDSLNRLTSTNAQVGTNGLSTLVTVTYDEIGNIKTKSDIGTYAYDSTKANGQKRPHAVSSITMTNGSNYATYTYDPNGNLVSATGVYARSTTWNSWNMPNKTVGSGSNTPANTTSSSFDFIYNASHERAREVLPDGTVVKNMSPRVDTGIHIEVRQKNGITTMVNSLYAGSMPFGAAKTVISATGAKTHSTSYYHADHLGSIIAVTDKTGTVIERRSFDAWGKRRNQNGTAMSNAFVTSDVRHAFTGHEDLGEVGLIHMNGRLYDPAIGRFLRADPIIQYPDYMQNYNRYSYIYNNPLSGVDYSGYTTLTLNPVTVTATRPSQSWSNFTTFRPFLYPNNLYFYTLSPAAKSKGAGASTASSAVSTDYNSNDLFGSVVHKSTEWMRNLPGGLLGDDFAKGFYDERSVLDHSDYSFAERSGAIAGTIFDVLAPDPEALGAALATGAYGQALFGLAMDFTPAKLAKVDKLVNANSLLSTRSQHLYEIYTIRNGEDYVIKTGVSSGKETLSKESYRARSQLGRIKAVYGDNVYTRIVDRLPEGPGARAEILRREDVNATRLRDLGQLNDKFHIRP